MNNNTLIEKVAMALKCARDERLAEAFNNDPNTCLVIPSDEEYAKAAIDAMGQPIPDVIKNARECGIFEPYGHNVQILVAPSGLQFCAIYDDPINCGRWHVFKGEDITP